MPPSEGVTQLLLSKQSELHLPVGRHFFPKKILLTFYKEHIAKTQNFVHIGKRAQDPSKPHTLQYNAFITTWTQLTSLAQHDIISHKGLFGSLARNSRITEISKKDPDLLTRF